MIRHAASQAATGTLQIACGGWRASSFFFVLSGRCFSSWICLTKKNKRSLIPPVAVDFLKLIGPKIFSKSSLHFSGNFIGKLKLWTLKLKCKAPLQTWAVDSAFESSRCLRICGSECSNKEKQSGQHPLNTSGVESRKQLIASKDATIFHETDWSKDLYFPVWDWSYSFYPSHHNNCILRL